MNLLLQHVRYRLRPQAVRFFRHAWAVIWRTLVKYNETDAEQRAASFAYYAFFSLFPLILLLISIGTAILGDKGLAERKVTAFVAQYIPVESSVWRTTIYGVVESRNSAGVIAGAVLAWSAVRFFQSLVRGVNKAWGTKEYSWWRLPIQNFLVVGIVAGALLLGIFAPTVIDMAELYYWQDSWMFGLDFAVAKQFFLFLKWIVPSLILFYAFSVFYRVAPRRHTKFREVWLASLLVMLGLQGLQKLYVLYTTNIADFNRLYGALGGVLALLLWIYLSGSVIIIGGCLSASEWEIEHRITDQSEKSTAG